MPLWKDVASQKLAVYAFDTVNQTAKTGDAANITGQISKDGGASAATNDANPTELDATNHAGIYLFDLTQAESAADLILLQAKSTTANIRFEPVVIYTLPKVWQMKVTITDDDTGSNDRYVVAFFENGQPITSGITSPDIWVFTNGGADLVGTSASPTSLTQIGTTGIYTLNETTNRIADGTAYVARVRATINGSTRTWYQPISRDS